MKYSLLTEIIPMQGQSQKGGGIPVEVELPDDAIPLQVEYRPVTPPSVALHYLVPIEEEAESGAGETED